MREDGSEQPSRLPLKKIILASQEKVEIYAAEVEQVLEALGHPEALVTDLSLLCDFFEYDPSDKSRLELEAAELSARLGVSVRWDQYLWEVAKSLRDSPSV